MATRNKEQQYFDSCPLGTSDGDGGYHLMNSDNTIAYHLTPNLLTTWTCTCAGYSYRNDCKHRRYLLWLSEARRQARLEALEAERLELVAIAEKRIASIQARLADRLTPLTRIDSLDYHTELELWRNRLAKVLRPVTFAVAAIAEKAVA